MHLVRYLPEILLTLLAGSQHSSGICTYNVSFICQLATIDMRSDGLKMLEVALASLTRTNIVQIRRLVVPGVPSGTLLLRLAPFAHSVIYDVYRESVFRLPAGIDLVELSLHKADRLRSFVIDGKSRVRQLLINRSLLNRIPPTVGMLRNLQVLWLTNGKLTDLPMDVAFNVPELALLHVTFNQISELSLSSTYAVGRPGTTSALRELELAGNRLEFLDMAVFAPFQLLERLTLMGNRLKWLQSSKPTILPGLKALTLDHNNLTALGWDNGLVLPNLTVLLLSHNAIAQLPTNWGPLRKLEVLILEGNKLKLLDMSGFRSLTSINSINILNNELETVLSSGPTFALPKLSMMNLSKNRISKINLAGCRMPKLRTFIANDNLLQVVPAHLFQQVPGIGIIMKNNPLKCSSLLEQRSQLVSRKLQSTLAPSSGAKCSNNSIPINELNQTVCCEG